MTALVLAFILFIALHSVPAFPTLRNGAITLLGRRGYFAAYSLVSLLSLSWLFGEALRTPYIELWAPAGWQATITLIASPLGLFLVLAGLFSRNPLSVNIRGEGASGAIVAYTRHPVLWGFALWAGGHLIVNGDLRSLLLFGGLALFSIGGFFMLDRRAQKRLGTAWPTARREAPLVPFTGTARLTVDGPMLSALLVTVAITAALLLGGHTALFGADPLLALQY